MDNLALNIQSLLSLTLFLCVLTYLYFFPIGRYFHYLWQIKSNRLETSVDKAKYAAGMTVHCVNSTFFILITVFALSVVQTGGASGLVLLISCPIQFGLIVSAEKTIRDARGLEPSNVAVIVHQSGEEMELTFAEQLKKLFLTYSIIFPVIVIAILWDVTSRFAAYDKVIIEQSAVFNFTSILIVLYFLALAILLRFVVLGRQVNFVIACLVVFALCLGFLMLTALSSGIVNNISLPLLFLCLLAAFKTMRFQIKIEYLSASGSE